MQRLTGHRGSVTNVRVFGPIVLAVAVGVAGAYTVHGRNSQNATAPTPSASEAPLASPSPTAQPSIGALISPQPLPAIPNYNPRYGSNRAAAEVSVLIARQIYKDSGPWEVYIRTDPLILPVTVDLLDPSTLTAADQSIKSANVILATESGLALRAFSAGGHSHEQQVTQATVQLVLKAFAKIAGVSFDIYFGESDHHATGALTRAGKLTYTVLDRL